MTQIGSFPSGLAAGQPENVADVVTMGNQVQVVLGFGDREEPQAVGLDDGVLAPPGAYSCVAVNRP
jgi:hypothetical protein